MIWKSIANSPRTKREGDPRCCTNQACEEDGGVEPSQTLKTMVRVDHIDLIPCIQGCPKVVQNGQKLCRRADSKSASSGISLESTQRSQSLLTMERSEICL